MMMVGGGDVMLGLEVLSTNIGGVFSVLRVLLEEMLCLESISSDLEGGCVL